jgi:hypothetical protein
MNSCQICDCKCTNFEPNVFDPKYCKVCYHNNEKHQKGYVDNSRPKIVPKEHQVNQVNIPTLRKVNNPNSPNNQNNQNNQNNKQRIVSTSQPLDSKNLVVKLDQSLNLTNIKNQLNEGGEGEGQKLSASLDIKATPNKIDRKKLLVSEIISTENEYVKSMSYLLQNYLRVLQDTMTTNDINLIFSNMIWIFNINSEFESELNEFKKNDCEMKEMFEILSKYVKISTIY